MKKNLFALMALAFWVNACTKMDEGVEATSNSTFGSKTSTVSGTVTRVSDGKPVSGSAVILNYATALDAHGNPTAHGNRQTNCDNNGNFILSLTNSEVGTSSWFKPTINFFNQSADAPYYLAEFIDNGVPIVPVATQHSMQSPLPTMEFNRNKRVDVRLHDIQYLNVQSKNLTLEYQSMLLTVDCISPITNQVVSQAVHLNNTGFNAVRLPTKANGTIEARVTIFKAVPNAPLTTETRKMTIKMDKKEVFLEMPN